MRGTAKKKQKSTETMFLVCALALAVGTPGLTLFDMSEYQSYGIFNLTSIWRLAVFGVIGCFVYILLLGGLVINVGVKPKAFGMWYLWVFFAWLALASLFSASTFHELAEAGYRLFEWATAIIIIQYFIADTRPHPLQTFIRLMKCLPLVTALLFAILLFYNPLLLYGHGRLGGNAMHPNSLAVVLGLGSLYWFYTGTVRSRYLLAFVLFVACFLTGSRAGVVATVVAYFVVWATKSMVQNRSNSITRITFISTSTICVLAGLISVDSLMTIFLRGDSLVYLKGAAGRMDVWMGALDLTKQSPIWGHGFVIGPKLLRDSIYIPEHWFASHAHNDFLNAAVAGGVVAAILLSVVYVNTFKTLALNVSKYPILFATFIFMVIVCSVESGISTQIGVRGFLFAALIRVSAMVHRKSKVMGSSETYQRQTTT